ncbi:MAG: dihydroorotase [Candidatus Neomarinimicrobiota bacterium]
MQSRPLPRLYLIRNANIIDPVREKEFGGEIFLKNGRIVEIGKKVQVEESSGKVEEVDAEGRYVTHGFCDIHAHFREPGREDKETLVSGSRAALGGGFTTVCVMPNTDPPLDTPELIRFIVEKAADLPVNIHPIGAVTRNQDGEELTEMAAMVREGAVAFSDDGIPLKDGGVVRRALEYTTSLGVPIINHSEDPQLKGEGQMNEGVWSTRLGLAGIPGVSESAMVSRDVQLAEFTGGRLHVPHVTTRESAEWIRWAKERQLKVTAEVAPHHLYFTDADLSTYDTNLKVAPPIRSEADRQALIECLRDGTVDCLATDHSPHTVEEKEAPFDWAPCGMIGLESAFGAIWKVLSGASFSLIEMVQKITINPRSLFGFETDLFRKGTPAELVFFDPEKEWTFSREQIQSKSRNSPFLGKGMRGKVLQVIARGMIHDLPPAGSL